MFCHLQTKKHIKSLSMSQEVCTCATAYKQTGFSAVGSARVWGA